MTWVTRAAAVGLSALAGVAARDLLQREHTLQRVPYLLVVGDREKENGMIAVRTRGGEDLGSMSIDQFAARLLAEGL